MWRHEDSSIGTDVFIFRIAESKERGTCFLRNVANYQSTRPIITVHRNLQQLRGKILKNSHDIY
jgi:hypothetical protein